LKDGGSAVDAAVACVLCLGVLQPLRAGLGGLVSFYSLDFFSVIKFLGRLLLIFPFCGRTYKQTYGRTDTETDFSMSTPSSSPNKAGLIVCPSVHRFVHPSTKINSDLNEILYTGRGR